MVTTTATTPTTSTATVSGSSILTSLGAGSGVDTASLIKSLVSAQFAAKNASLSAQDTALTAQISSVAKVQSAITSFASALTSLVTGGSLASQPTSSDASVLTATALPGAKLAGLSTQVTVNALATAQTAIAGFPSGAPTFDAGTLTLTFGTAADSAVSSLTTPSAPIQIAIAQGAKLTDVAAAINASGKGLTASVVTDVNGAAYLSMKGPTGTAQAFTLSGTGNLSQLNVGGGSGTAAASINSNAGNANLTVDGVSVDRTSNTISDLVAGVKLTLTGVSPRTSTTTSSGTTSVAKPVSLGSTTPRDGIAQAVTDFVTTYNQVLAELKTETDPATGPLRSDYNATNLLRSLRGLTVTPLSSGGAAGDPVNLASIGVATNKDGTLSVDSTKLNTALLKTPAAVEALFANGTGATGGGLAAALNAITSAATNNKVIVNGQAQSTGLVGSTALYTAKLAKVNDAEAQVTTDTAAYQDRLTKQYAASDAMVAAYKASAKALQSQIDQWNKTGG